MKNLIPHLIVDNFERRQFYGRFPAVGLFIDLSGFTAMTETLMQHGKDGAEVLSGTLMRVFEPLVNAVHAHGGLIAGFAGDAFTALFPLENSQLAIDNALAAARTIQQHVAQNAIQSTSLGDFTFAVKLGLADGEAEWSILRSHEEPYQHSYYFKGSAVDQCAYAEHHAGKGDLIITTSLYAQLGDRVTAEAVADYWRVTDATPELPAVPAPTVAELEPTALKPFLPDEVIFQQARGEFRQVVSVFISVSGLDNAAAIDDFIQHVFRLQRRYGGFLTHLDFGDKGCNLLLFWGAPVGFENDAERALNFVLDLRQQFPAKKGGVAIRAGVTQRVMYAGYAGGSQRGEYTCYGRGVNLAARQMMQAEWGEIWLGERMAVAAQDAFETEELGRRQFKGFAEPQPIYRLKGRRSAGRTISYEGQMVGRDAELARLQEFAAPVFGLTPGFAGLMYVYGEAGMGKSRLIYEFRQQLRQRHDIEWLLCPCDEILRQSLNPFKYCLKNLFHQSPDHDEARNKIDFERQFDQLAARLKEMTFLGEMSFLRDEVLNELLRTRSILAGMMDLRYPGSLYEALDPKLRFENTLFAFKNLIKALSLLKPVILSIEDIHWVDSDSRELVRVLTRGLNRTDVPGASGVSTFDEASTPQAPGTFLNGFPIAVLCASRYLDDDSKPVFEPDENMPQQEIDLNILSPDGIRGIAEQVVKSSVADDVVKFLTEKTQGNPFFVEQLTLNLKEQGFLIAQNGHFALQTDNLAEIPANVTAVLIARLDRLPLAVKQVVQTASVLGREFEIPILEHMIQEDATLADSLRSAAHAAVWSAQSNLNYIFKHALMRDAAYEMQFRSRLRELHQRAGQAFEAVHRQDPAPYYADLAYHFEKAEIMDKAESFLVKAGNVTKEKYQNASAIGFYERALGYLRGNYANWPLLAEALKNKGSVHELIGQYDPATACYEELLKRAEEMGDLKEQGNGLEGLATLNSKLGKNDLAHQFSSRNLILQKELGSLEGEATALNSLGILSMVLGKSAQARDYFDSALSIRFQMNDLNGQVKILLNIGTNYGRQKQLNDALPFFAKGLELSKNTNDKQLQIKALNNYAIVLSSARNYKEALQFFCESRDLSKHIGDKHSEAITIQNLPLCYISMSEVDKAVESYQHAIALFELIGVYREVIQTYCYMAEDFIEMKDYEAAVITCKKADEIIAKRGLADCKEMVAQIRAKIKQAEHALAHSAFDKP